MPEDQTGPVNAEPAQEETAAASDKVRARRTIPGNLTYITTPTALKNVLEKIIDAEVPDRFSYNFLSNILGYTGGSYRQTIPILKKLGFLSSDGQPTELYSQFRTESGRPDAVYNAMRQGFSELFRRNEYIHAADEKKLLDHIVEITGLKRGDSVVSSIRSTFTVLSSLLPKNFVPSGKIGREPEGAQTETTEPTDRHEPTSLPDETRLNLSYNINIVLPDTRDIEVFNAIFRSVRENLLR